MSRYPDDFYTEARIDPDEVADYVAENWDYFSERCDPSGTRKEDIKELIRIMDSVLCDNDENRRLRDSSHDYTTDRGVILYNEYLKIRDELAKLAY